MERGSILRSITESNGLHGEALPGVPFLELNGDDRILVENHKCVVGYTDSEILIRVSFGLIRIYGCSMELTRIDSEQLVIRGIIHGINLIK